jgi:hypothetical protein
VTLERTKDGYFLGSNLPMNPRLIREETDFDPKDRDQSSVSRRARWEQLMKENRGKIDAAAARRFLADHYDTFANRNQPSERTLDGHIDLSPRGSLPWAPPYSAVGAVQNKVSDAGMAERLSFTAALGHACGLDFKAAAHLKEHPEFRWQKSILKDMPARPWTTFAAAQ